MARSGSTAAARAAAIGAGVAAGAVGGAWVLQRTVAARLRRRPDPDAHRRWDLPRPVDTIPSHDGGTIALERVGAGTPVVLAHGVTLTMRIWSTQLETLPGRDLDVVAYDSRGHGASRAGRTGYSMSNLGADLRTVLETLDLRGAVLVGHSMGGMALQTFAVEHPDVLAERVAGIVLLSTMGRFLLGVSPLVRTAVEQLAGRGPGSSRLFGRRDLGFLLARLAVGRDPQPRHVELTREMVASCPDDAVRGSLRAITSFDVTASLGQVRVPTLVICGSADLLTPPTESRRLARLVPGARLEMVPRGGHMLMLERPGTLDDLVGGFAEQLRAGAPAPDRT